MSILGTLLKAHVNNQIYESKQGRFRLVFPILIRKIVSSSKIMIKNENL
jgi:hypothetical protein